MSKEEKELDKKLQEIERRMIYGDRDPIIEVVAPSSKERMTFDQITEKWKQYMTPEQWEKFREKYGPKDTE